MIDQEKDWLAEEIKYESRISAWDLDEPNKVKRLHEDNCPREKLARQHMKMHESNEPDSVIQSRVVKSNIKLNNKQSQQAQKLANVISTIIVVLFLIALFNVLFG